MKVSKFNRELASGIADLNARLMAPVESAVNAMAKAVGMVLAVGTAVWWLLAVLADCGGMTC